MRFNNPVNNVIGVIEFGLWFMFRERWFFNACLNDEINYFLAEIDYNIIRR